MGKKNRRGKKQPNVGKKAYREHDNKYASKSKFKHNAYGVRED